MQILNGWKEVAAYLGRGVRTVQRWEHDFELPVHRPKRSDRSAVLAFPEEIDAWLRRTPLRSQLPADCGTHPGIAEEPRHALQDPGKAARAQVDARARIRASMSEVQRSLRKARELRAGLAERVRDCQATTAAMQASMQKVVIKSKQRSRTMVA